LQRFAPVSFSPFARADRDRENGRGGEVESCLFLFSFSSLGCAVGRCRPITVFVFLPSVFPTVRDKTTGVVPFFLFFYYASGDDASFPSPLRFDDKKSLLLFFPFLWLEVTAKMHLSLPLLFSM